MGNKCIGAKVNSKMVPLNTELKTGDIISVITSKSGKPSRDWINIAKTTHCEKQDTILLQKGKQGRKHRKRAPHCWKRRPKRHSIPANDLLQKDWLQRYCDKNTLKTIDDLYATTSDTGEIATGQVLTYCAQINIKDAH